jgi:excisionase family DNA binding protein
MDPFLPHGLTTSQAAILLQVHESSLKRWTNAGELALEKTAGGHRRIAVSALVDFARRRRLSADLLYFSPHEEDVAAAALAAQQEGDFEELRELFLRFCDTRSPRWITRLIRYLEEAFGLSRARIFDEGIAGALAEVGTQWMNGSRTIALEHRFSQKILDALHGLLALEPEPEAAETPRRHAVVGCAENGHHEIASLMARLLLERQGWSVTYLGASVPFEEMAGIQELERAELVCVSFSPPQGVSDARRCLRILSALHGRRPAYTLAIGGAGLPADADFVTGLLPFRLKIVETMSGLDHWIREEFPS